jgi:hypothetical protein
MYRVEFAELKVALVSGIVGGVLQIILNALLLIGVNKVLLFKSVLITARFQHISPSHILHSDGTVFIGILAHFFPPMHVCSSNLLCSLSLMTIPVLF